MPEGRWDCPDCTDASLLIEFATSRRKVLPKAVVVFPWIQVASQMAAANMRIAELEIQLVRANTKLASMAASMCAISADAKRSHIDLRRKAYNAELQLQMEQEKTLVALANYDTHVSRRELHSKKLTARVAALEEESCYLASL